MASPIDDDLDPEAARVLVRVRRLMAVSVAFTGLAVAAVLGVVGYRIFTSEGSMPAAASVVTLPQGAKVVATAVTEERIVVTVEVGGQTELHLFDLATLAPRGRLRLTAAP